MPSARRPRHTPPVPAQPILGEALRERVRVRNWGSLFRRQLLVHIEGVVVDHEGHERGQEPGDQLHLLCQKAQERSARPRLCPAWTLSLAHLPRSTFSRRQPEGLSLLPTPETPPSLVSLGPTEPLGEAVPPEAHYHLGLLEDLAVNHVPCALAQRQQPEQQ